jgi:hypothetical protein
MTRGNKTVTEAAALLRDRLKEDPVLARTVAATVERSGHSDVYEWCEAHPDFAIALADQLDDIDGQVANMSYLLSQGDLS